MPAYAFMNRENGIEIFSDRNGIRVFVKDEFEFYFNKTNGGEITEYFDLMVDPSRSRNLANIGWKPYYILLPLFASLFYRPPNPEKVFSTGGDANAELWLIGNTSEYAILQSSSRVMSRSGEVTRDAYGNVIYVNSTWVIRASGLVSVERTFFVPNYMTIMPGWRWYPFYLTRRAGFNYDGTFYIFNTTYTHVSVVNEEIYRDIFGLFPLLPNDTRRVFGVALPFSNTSIGGDGAHNILIAYKYDEMLNVNEWRSDNYHSQRNNITESGAVHEFSKATNVSAHTYHIMVNFTRQRIDERSVQDFAKYHANNAKASCLLQTNVTTSKSTYSHGDSYKIYGSGVSYYNLTEITAKLAIEDSVGQVIFLKNYGPGNLTEGQRFNATLFNGTVPPSARKGNYTIAFQIFSSVGIIIASDRKTIEVV